MVNVMGGEDIFASCPVTCTAIAYKCLVHVPLFFLYFVVSIKQTKQAKVDILMSSA
jgi:hypothetical protein